MHSDAEGDDEGIGLDAYWRRRVLVLGGVLAGVGVLAWACSHGEDRRPVSGAAASASPAASASAVPTAMPTITATVTARVTVTPAAPRRNGDACDPKDVVVGLAPTKGSYGGKDRPVFRLTVVNTGARSCTYGVGPRELELRVTSGSDRVWSSAHCAGGPASTLQLLRRGIPHITETTWDRRRSSDGCPGGRSTARPGTYVVTVKGAKVPKQVFRLT
ncbi:hypothetical protein DPM19_11525 [Actinomadura craniellae]|uniref:DUF4232 domain-containing protein n=1 Tax=Actinomadura craniellae TaxID=2231787 RepID=A0A365H8G6_9ACTN|nr:hypothetical protein [Actinomadura craniellae]RAY15329.1 hypothetical protein DPM19_11525 [Actinomadura craniellae]